MSLVMERNHHLASSRLQRSSTGAVKSGPFRSSSVGASSSSTYGSSSTVIKQTRSSGCRVLPNGPGPLPNRPYIFEKSGGIKYVASGSSRVPPVSHVIHQKSSGLDSPAARRKTSNDSGYASSSKNGYTYGELKSGKSKSLSHLNSRVNETNDFSRPPANRSRRESSTLGASSRTAGHISHTQYHVGTKSRTLNGGSNTKSSSTDIYRSTTQLDYKDPSDHEDRKSLYNGAHSYLSHRDLSNTGKDNYSLRDLDKTRKATITALPGSDMKCTRKSSFSSSNSSPSNSVSICCRKIIIWFICQSLTGCSNSRFNTLNYNLELS